MAAIRFKFRGEEIVIPEAQAFAAGEAVEEVVTMAEIGSWGNRVKFFRLARAFGTLARFGGCDVTDEEVHAEMMAAMERFGQAVIAARAAGEAEPAQDVQGIFAFAAIRALQAVLVQAVPQEMAAKSAPAEKQPAAS